MYYYRYGTSEVSCCYKYLMFSYNIIFWLAGAAFIAIGFWAWSEKGILRDLTQVTQLHGFDPVWLVLLVGGVTFTLGFAGCVGALRENICLLKFFSGLIGLIFVLEMTVAVLAIVFQSQVREWINEFFIVNIRAYRDDIDLQNLIDSLQKMPDWEKHIYMKGCIAALEDWLPRNLYMLAVVFIIISLLQMVGIYLARTLISDIEKVKFSY
ncbi:hypothetical protein fugu_012424 [Takifugu bimaculatus]|uniref:Tetraspanin n=1 Tax=Takifugu bimaculatus TaxID=433685 RepID=A0A4Z2C5C2_9TELE|nr:hypothetical protein fugu_012424 [Takifugu bimaculatus]